MEQIEIKEEPAKKGISEALLNADPFLITKLYQIAWNSYGYNQVLLVGSQGCGKTTYANQNMFQCTATKQNPEGDWEKVLKYTIFDPMEFLLTEHRELLRTKSRLNIPVTFDDAALHFSKYLHFMGKEQINFMVRVNYIFNTIRLSIPLTIFTSPDDDIMLELRRKSWIFGIPKILLSKKYDLKEDKEEDEDVLIDELQSYDPSLSMSKRRQIKLFQKQLSEWDITKSWSKEYGVNQYFLILPSDYRKAYDEKRSLATLKVYEDMDMKEDEAKDMDKRIERHILSAIKHYKIMREVKMGMTMAYVEAKFNYNAPQVHKEPLKHNLEINKKGICHICNWFDASFKSQNLGFGNRTPVTSIVPKIG